MALFGFGKKNDGKEVSAPARDEQPEETRGATAGVDGAGPEVLPSGIDGPDPVHDAVAGEVGPFDGGSVDIRDFDFSDFADGALNLGSLVVPLPRGSEVQVEMGENGPRMLHIITPHGRITPVAFAAPRSAGQWRESTREITEGMRKDGLSVHVEHGPWGREVVGAAGEAVIRIIGVDGPRWMLRMTLAAPAGSADELAQLGRDVTARTFVHRGDGPLPAGQSLPVALPEPLAKQVTQAMQERLKKARETGTMDTRDLRARAATPAEAAQQRSAETDGDTAGAGAGTGSPAPEQPSGQSPETSAMQQIRKTER
ncbi:DUF3710 domain-containing protein [Corynebacterium pygosceleis]|uniref:DUF3710 domain-containing protein n=1 Tax=Corynebacterium pygosceleis TaxID=2800406 RepID=A0A9Q4C623_9CORY|nr:DUF3710 domain-containing protein [Corynebacterium pygosceleis]MCK7636898.1 DUF3710 domain-containing protein [Corynebacterium pygosceleis]MCK7674372.1 DUF3710 domain-containing protein [Corynebacterium pygosceleis]MCL0120330.1 DUF3710 domain-containing protein [Corynebacterium pygosceleis]MCX7467651.1 DUF3710 domain-containing protein [Corynebacterium pygosceleis]